MARPYRYGCVNRGFCFKTEVYVSRLSLYSLVLLAGVGAAVVACGSDDDNPTSTAGAGGKAAAGAGGKGSAGAGKGGAASAGEGGEGGAPAETTLYERLGGHDGIKGALGAIVMEELKDDDIASFFAPNLQDASHVPQAGDIIDCFTNLLGKAAGGAEKYPFKTATGFTCRDMASSHADLHISGGTFDNFVVIAAGVLKKAKVADADIAVIGTVLNGTKDDIVDPAAAVGPCTAPACAVGEGGAGGAAGAGN